jgi:dihydrofolate synthase/folylpolyglutamate synthase
VRWPGRFQILRRDPVVVLDGAHNPAGARALAASLATYFPGQRVTFVVGISRDKDRAGILEALAPLAARFIFAAAGHPRATPPEQLQALLPPGGPPSETAPSAAEALAMALAPPHTPIVCVAGSLFLIGEILAQAPEKQDLLCGSGVRC